MSENLKKLLSKKELQVVKEYYKKLGLKIEIVAMAILEGKSLGMSLGQIIKVFNLSVKYKNDPVMELEFIKWNYNSFSEEDKKRFNHLVQTRILNVDG